MTDTCDSRNAITDFVPLKDAFLPFGQLFPPGEKPFQGRVMRSLVIGMGASRVFSGRLKVTGPLKTSLLVVACGAAVEWLLEGQHPQCFEPARVFTQM